MEAREQLAAAAEQQGELAAQVEGLRQGVEARERQLERTQELTGQLSEARELQVGGLG